MIKIVLWRILFDIINLRKILFENKKTIKYFAFGANLDPACLRRRKINVLNEMPFTLRDYEMKFSHPGAFEGMGFSSIEHSSGKKVYGKLYTLSSTDARRLDYYELVPCLGRYRRVFICQDGEHFFCYQSCMPKEGLRPSANYLASIINGFKKAPHIPAEYRAEIEATSVLEILTPAKNLEFRVKNIDKWPRAIRPILHFYDKVAIKLFIKYIKDSSLTERWIHA